MKWCPSPGCTYAVECGAAEHVSCTPLDIACKCSSTFCWNCNQEAHRPVDCATVAKCARPTPNTPQARVTPHAHPSDHR